MNKERLQYLLEKWMDRTTRPEEARELAARLEEHREDGTVPELLIQLIEQTEINQVLPMEDRERSLLAILEIDKTNAIHTKTTHLLRISFRRWGWVAASVLLLLAEVAVVMLAINANWKEQHAQDIIQDIAPGSNKAVLTLGNGATIRLDSAGGQLIQQGTVTVRQAGAQPISK